jgi:hypothetical protein
MVFPKIYSMASQIIQSNRDVAPKDALISAKSAENSKILIICSVWLFLHIMLLIICSSLFQELFIMSVFCSLESIFVFALHRHQEFKKPWEHRANKRE